MACIRVRNTFHLRATRDFRVLQAAGKPPAVAAKQSCDSEPGAQALDSRGAVRTCVGLAI